MQRVWRWSSLTPVVVLSVLLLANAASAIPLYLGIDAARSSIAPPVGPAAPLSGYLRVDVGSLPPNVTTVPFNLLTVAAETVISRSGSIRRLRTRGWER